MNEPIHIDDDSALTIGLVGAAQLIIEAGCYLGTFYAHANAGGGIKIGAGVTVNDAGFIAHEGCWIRVGADCMFAEEIIARTSDEHLILDMETGERINPARDIEIGSHVWIGRGAIILKGAEIGSGSVVGTMSLVTGKIEASSLIAGVPARVVRRGIRWER